MTTSHANVKEKMVEEKKFTMNQFRALDQLRLSITYNHRSVPAPGSGIHTAKIIPLSSLFRTQLI